MKRLELPTYEADDIIGTLATLGEQTDFEKIHIITGDKDLLQMADEKTTVHITRKGVTDIESFTPEAVFAKYELSPSQIVDLKGLMGDPSDNLTGIPGVGEKTAIKLLKQFKIIARKKWIESVANGHGNIGLTFEHEIGKKFDSNYTPDFIDIKIKCIACGREIMLDRLEFEKKLRRVINEEN